MLQHILLFGVPENPLIWIIILAAIFLLFGGSRLPQLAKALGQSKRAFREGIEEGEAEADREAQRKQLSKGEAATAAPAELTAVDDEALFEEARRRAAAKRAAEEKSNPRT
jgi:sec-independent protein translocase protein TatA